MNVKALNEHLRGAREEWVGACAEGASGQVHVVMGNQSCDMDSMTCALTRFLELRTHTPAVNAFVLFNIPKKDLKLRTEAVYTDLVLYLEDVQLDRLSVSGRLRLHLVDHNCLADTQSSLGTCVSSIVDHHVDESLYDCEDVVIRPVGSCATLMSLKRVYSTCDSKIALLLLSPILLDTSCLDASQCAQMEADDEAQVKRLSAIAKVENVRELYEKLIRAKFDVSTLTNEQLLRKDYKQWRFTDRLIGISSVTTSLTRMCNREKSLSFIQQLVSYRDSLSLDLLVVMFAFKEEHFRRQLLLCVRSRDEQLLHMLSTFLEAQKDSLAVERLQMDNSSDCDALVIAFEQLKVKSSRKVVQPLLKAFFGASDARARQ